jgi:predicted nucleic acid-binding protein
VVKWIAAQCIENNWVLVTDDTDFNYSVS